MTSHRLTCRQSGVTVVAMERKPGRGGQANRRVVGALAAVLGVAMLSGCVSVNAPDKPIVIELNVNIQQEVVYRLAPDAAETAKKNATVF